MLNLLSVKNNDSIKKSKINILKLYLIFMISDFLARLLTIIENDLIRYVQKKIEP